MFFFTRVGNNPKKCEKLAKKLTDTLMEELGREPPKESLPYAHIDNDP